MIRVNLLGLPKTKKRAPVVTMQGGRWIAFFVAVLVVVGAVQFLRYGHLRNEEQRLTKLVQDEQAEKSRLETVRSEYDRLLQQKELLVKRTEIIEGLKAKQAGPARLLDSIASTVTHTETLWLTNYEQVGPKVTIEGAALSAKAVADFMTHLKDSKAFSDMNLKETVQDPSEKELRKFLFTLNGELAEATPTT
jgi:Tfp pilus assembly protein PilN